MKKIFISIISVLFVCILFGQTPITIRDARASDANGVLTNLGAEVVVEGKAIGTNYNPGGQTFAIFNAQDGIGISVFSLDDDLGYTFSENDNLRITGTVDQFRGLAQIAATAIDVMPDGGADIMPLETTVLDENTESALVTFRNATVVNPDNWLSTGIGSGFNLQLTNGTDIIAIRIDGDVDIAGMPVPTGVFDITGVGGQFDNDEPLNEGYQLLPRSIADINPYVTGGGGGDPVYQQVTMPDLRANDSNGLPLLLDELVEVTATVYGLNRRADQEGVQFTIIDDNNVGVGIFDFDSTFGYTVRQGDMITVQGTVNNFNGLTQIFPDTIMFLSSLNPLVTPRIVDQLDESTESSLVEIPLLEIEDEVQWIGDGGNFNVNFLTQNGEIILVRIEDQTDISNVPFQGLVTPYFRGIGGQFDTSDPRDEEYQLLPRFLEDIGIGVSNENIYKGEIEIFPNPIETAVTITADNSILSASVYDLQGRKLLTTFNKNTINVSSLSSGNYILLVDFEEGLHIEKVTIR